MGSVGAAEKGVFGVCGRAGYGRHGLWFWSARSVSVYSCIVMVGELAFL